MEDKARMVSELYQEKSNLYQNISILNSDGYKIIVGYERQTLSLRSWNMGSYNFKGDYADLNRKIKQITIEFYEQKLLEIDQKLDQLLKC